MAEAGSARQRYFVAIATGKYDDSSWNMLEIDSEVSDLSAWLCSPQLGEDRIFEHRFPELAESPSEDDIRRAFRPPQLNWSESAAAFVFVTGHGVSDDDHEHWMILRDTSWRDWETTAFRTIDLIKWLRSSRVEHLVLVLDMCSAGDILRKVVARDFPPNWVILPSTVGADDAVLRGFTMAIRDFLSELSTDIGGMYGATDEYLTVEMFLQGVQAKLRNGQRLEPLTSNRLLGAHLALPNPHYKAATALHMESRRAELAIPASDLATHWDPRSRGVASADQVGWLFTGRSKLMRELIAAAGGQSGVTLVTGAAGSGKSAALARLVTLTDPNFRADHHDVIAGVPADLRPEVGLVDAAVVATGKTSTEIFGQLVTAFGVQVPHRPTLDEIRRAWARWTTTLQDPITIVIDAFDEAADPLDVIGQVLSYLADASGLAPMIRLMIGVRSPGRAAEPTVDRGAQRPLADRIEEKLQARRIAVDENPWWDPGDVVSYAKNILLNTPGSPYSRSEANPENERLADELARSIGAQVGKSFLVARIAAVSLASRDYLIYQNDLRWNLAITAGVQGVFRDDLHATLKSAEDRERAVQLLRALSFAEGQGLPWFQIWPIVTNAVVNGPTYGDYDIAWLLQTRLGAYVIIDHEAEMPVYRLFHHFLRDILRDGWQELLAAPTELEMSE